ncbi:MAG: redoxin domain-containing protein [Nitrospinota bacterium]
MSPDTKILVHPRSILVFLGVSLIGYWLLAGSLNRVDIVQAKEIIPAPEVVLEKLEGGKIPLKDYRGKWVFINFWATWCPPCIKEMPAMEGFYNKFKKHNLVMLAVSIDKKKELVVEFVKKYNLTFEIFIDSETKVAKQFGVKGIPATFILNPQGEIVSQAAGARKWMDPSIIDYFEKLMAVKESEKDNS